MKAALTLAVVLSLFSGIACAQTNSILDNLPDDTRQNILKNLSQGLSEDGTQPAPQQFPNGSAPLTDSAGDSGWQDDSTAATKAVAQEQIDREKEIQALKAKLETEILELQKKVDAQQMEINELRYKTH
jgi:hypothetical protein